MFLPFAPFRAFTLRTLPNMRHPHSPLSYVHQLGFRAHTSDDHPMFNSMKPLILPLLAVTLLLSGCANPGVVQISPDTFQISRSSAAGAFANTSMLKAKVIREANLFAQKQGKVAVPLSINENRPSVGFPSCDVTFAVMSQQEYERQKQTRQREWSALTPAQRAEYTLRSEEIAQRDRAVASGERQSANAAASASLGNALNRSSYDQRTRALQQPVDVNVRGNMNHNVNGRINVYGY